MAHDIFTALSDLRMLTDGETDADSPGSEELMSQVRENIECLFIWLGLADSGGEIDTITETILTDSSKSWSTDEHNGRTLIITSGTAKGNKYTIDDTTSTTITMTGDTLASDGVQAGDYYRIFYDIMTDWPHDHDGTNSATISTLADDVVDTAQIVNDAVTAAKIDAGAVGTSALSTSTQEQSNEFSGSLGEYHTFTLTGGQYCFLPRFKAGAAAETIEAAFGLPGGPLALATSYAGPHITVAKATSGTEDVYVYHRYVNAPSDTFWYFILRDKVTKKIKARSAAPHHPCFNTGLTDEQLPHPWAISGFDEDKYEVVLINMSHQELRNVKVAAKNDKENVQNSILDALEKYFDVDETSQATAFSEEIPYQLDEDIDTGKLIPTYKTITVPEYVICKKIKAKA